MHRMGHASMRAALIYQHATSERDQEIAAGMNKRIDKAGGGRERAVVDQAVLDQEVIVGFRGILGGDERPEGDDEGGGEQGGFQAHAGVLLPGQAGPIIIIRYLNTQSLNSKSAPDGTVSRRLSRGSVNKKSCTRCRRRCRRGGNRRAREDTAGRR